MAVAYDIQQTVSPVDALWTLFQGQTKAIKKAFVERLLSSDTQAKAISRQITALDNTLSPALVRNIAEAREEYKKGETISCSTPEEMQRYFDSL